MTLGQNVPKLDALHLMDGIKGLRSLPKHSVDMLLTDPPYGTTRNFWDVPLPLPELWEAVRWAVKPNGAILFFAQCPFDKVLGASNLAMLRYEWVWYKSRATGFLNANRAPLKKSENILVFYQKSPVYHPQFTYGEPYRKTNPRSDRLRVQRRAALSGKCAVRADGDGRHPSHAKARGAVRVFHQDLHQRRRGGGGHLRGQRHDCRCRHEHKPPLHLL